jgi:hypothetical protein
MEPRFYVQIGVPVNYVAYATFVIKLCWRLCPELINSSSLVGSDIGEH